MVCELASVWLNVKLIVLKEETLTGMELFVLQEGMNKNIFVNDTTMAAYKSAQAIY